MNARFKMRHRTENFRIEKSIFNVQLKNHGVQLIEKIRDGISVRSISCGGDLEIVPTNTTAMICLKSENKKYERLLDLSIENENNIISKIKMENNKVYFVNLTFVFFNILTKKAGSCILRGLFKMTDGKIVLVDDTIECKFNEDDYNWKIIYCFSGEEIIFKLEDSGSVKLNGKLEYFFV